jgi:hypothetical protein
MSLLGITIGDATYDGKSLEKVDRLLYGSRVINEVTHGNSKRRQV